jgi:phage shock protein C
MSGQKRLYRSTKNKMLAGICGGIAEYLDADPTIVRLIFVLAMLTGLSVLIYLIMWVIIPIKA